MSAMFIMMDTLDSNRHICKVLVRLKQCSRGFLSPATVLCATMADKRVVRLFRFETKHPVFADEIDSFVHVTLIMRNTGTRKHGPGIHSSRFGSKLP